MSEPRVDPDQGIRFLRFLDGTAVAANKKFLFTWLHPKHKGMLHELYTADQWATVLAHKQRMGWNSFVTIHAMRGERRTKEDLTYTRAFFLDFDSVEPKISAAACPPDAIVQSKNGQHWYWRANDPPHIWEPTEQALVTAFGADGNAKDLARVLRMPGSLHLKDPSNPFLVTLERCEVRAPSLRTPELTRAFSLDLIAAARMCAGNYDAPADGDAIAPEHLAAFLRAVNNDPAGPRNLKRRPGKPEWVFDCPIKEHSHAKVVVLLKDSGTWTLFCQSGKPDCTRDNILDHFHVGWGLRYATPYRGKDAQVNHGQ